LKLKRILIIFNKNMSIIIDLYLCKHAKGCLGATACPTGALHWDNEKRRLSFDDEKCHQCGLCENACEADVISMKEYTSECAERKLRHRNSVIRPCNFAQERYGTALINKDFELSLSSFVKRDFCADSVVAVEVYDKNSIECLLYSIPIDYLFEKRGVKFRKMEVSDNFLSENRISTLPALLFFRDGKEIGRVEGFYNYHQRHDLLRKIENLGVFARR
jgi:Fe-S-cluster-containing hydrogenase component 2